MSFSMSYRQEGMKGSKGKKVLPAWALGGSARTDLAMEADLTRR